MSVARLTLFCISIVAAIIFCAKPANAGSHFTRNGNEAEVVIPFQVRLIRIRIRVGDDDDCENHVCSGSLLDRRHVLTAAHCVTLGRGETVVSTRSRRVVLGGQRLRPDGQSAALEAGVDKIIMHPDFHRRSLRNDIAVIKLDRNITFSEDIYPIGLASRKLRPAEHCRISGWGRIPGSGGCVNYLTEAAVIAIGFDECHVKSDTSEIFEGQEGQIVCTDNIYGNEEVGVCSGDSGGPLVSNSRGSAEVELHGVASFTVRPCGKHPSGYTNVPYYRTWIEQVIADTS